MKSFFLKSNLVLYSTHALNFIFGYLFILICTNFLGEENRFQFTGFISLFNIFLIPISCLGISLTGLYKDGIKNNLYYSIVYNRSLFTYVFLIILILILNFFFEINQFIQIEGSSYKYIIALLLINFFYSLENAENLEKQKFLNYSVINSLPFIIRFILISIFLVYLGYENFELVLIIYILSFSFLIKRYFLRLKNYGSIKKIFIIKKIPNLNFLKNLLTISIFSIVINIDIIASRYVDPTNSTNYYIESLFGKIVFFLSTIAVLFMYPTNIQGNKKNFFNVLILNILASCLLILFYYFFFNTFYFFLFPDMNLNLDVVLLISISCLFFSISNLISYKLNIFGFYYHSLLKLILTIVLIFYLFNSENINIIINYLIIFSILFVSIDLFFYKIFKKN